MSTVGALPWSGPRHETIQPFYRHESVRPLARFRQPGSENPLLAALQGQPEEQPLPSLIQHPLLAALAGMS